MTTAVARRWVSAEVAVPARDQVVVLALIGVGVALWLSPPGLVALVLLALAVGLAALSPLAALTVAILALPLTYRPVEIGGAEFSLLELATFAGAGGLALRLAPALRSGRRAQVLVLLRPWPTTVAAVAVLFAGALALTTVAERDYLRESVREVRWTIVEPIALFVLCRWVLRHRPASGVWMLAALASAGAIVGTAGVVEALGRAGGDEVERAQVLYPHPNNLAFFLERAGVVALGLGLGGGRPRLAWLAALLIAGGLVSSFSRGAILACGAGCVALVAGRRDRRLLTVVGALWALVGAGLLIGARERLFDLGGEGEEWTRLPIWRSSLRMALDHPTFGVGPDQFLYQYWRRYVEPAAWPERYTSHPHNLLLDLWLRLGILGVVAGLSLAVAVVVVARRSSRAAGERGRIGGIAAAALLAGLVHGLVDNGYFLPDVAAMTWIFIALVEGPPGGATAEIDTPQQSPEPVRHP